MSPSSTKKRIGSLRYVLAGGVFVLMIGVIAWITQFMPKGHTPVVSPMAKKTSAPTDAAAVRFAFLRAVWDPEDEEYAQEMEKGTKGHFDFPFENNLDEPAEIGFLRPDCDCSHMEIALLSSADWERYRQEIQKNPLTAQPGDWKWQEVLPSDTKGFEVPPSAKGLVRLLWQGRREPGQRLRLAVTAWNQPLANVGRRNSDRLEVPTIVAPPIAFTPIRSNVGNLDARASAVADFFVWSATRPDLDLQCDNSARPLFEYSYKPLTPEKCRELEKKLNKEKKERKESGSTRILKAYQFQVTVREQADGKQLDQGPFYHVVNFLLDDDKVLGPQILGAVMGNILVGNSEDRGKVNLKTFRAKEGTKRDVSLWTDEQTLLTSDSQRPATMDVNLVQEEKAGNRVKWRLEVTVPPDTQFGVFPEESVIILRTRETPARFIRIPVTGNGQF